MYHCGCICSDVRLRMSLVKQLLPCTASAQKTSLLLCARRVILSVLVSSQAFANCNKWLYCETAHLNSVNVTNKLHTVHSMWHAFSAISARVFLAFSSVAARGVEETRELHNDVIWPAHLVNAVWGRRRIIAELRFTGQRSMLTAGQARWGENDRSAVRLSSQPCAALPLHWQRRTPSDMDATTTVVLWWLACDGWSSAWSCWRSVCA